MKRLRLSLKQPDLREPGLYGDWSYPSGISNVANNCFASATLQFLFNHSDITVLAHEMFRMHPGNCDNTCCKKSKQF